MSILDMAKKINIWGLLGLCLVLSATLAIGGLKLSAFSDKKEPIRVDSSSVVAEISAETQEGRTTVDVSNENPLGIVVGSKSGRKYHLPECPGAKAIAEKNKITFKTIAEAKKAGYTPAANCPALKSL